MTDKSQQVGKYQGSTTTYLLSASTSRNLAYGYEEREVLEFDAAGNRTVIAVVPDVVALDVLDAVIRAYQQGQDDARTERTDR